MTSASRRQFNQLALAALSGALAGSVLGCSGGKAAEGSGTEVRRRH